MTNLETKLDWLWSRNQFINRKYLMQEMYQNYVEGEDWQLPDVTILIQMMYSFYCIYENLN